MILFKGSGVALVTPFDKKNKIDFNILGELLEFHVSNHTDSLIISGTTGESATLSDKEKINIFEFVVNKINKRIPVIAGTGSNNSLHAKKLSREAKSVGVDGLLIVTPYYNKTSQSCLIEHYKFLCDINLPIIIYNVPSRTGLNILPETYKKLLELENIVGIKEASGNISQVAELAYLKKQKEFAIYSGNDDQIVPVLSLGGDGVISVLANIFPREVHDMCEKYFEKNLKASLDLQLEFIDLIKNLFCEVNPMPIKAAMNLLNHKVNSCRLPLGNISQEKINKLKESLDKTKVWLKKYYEQEN